MGTKHPEIFAALAAPFAEKQVRHRSQGGRDLPYITARTVMNRLDEVLGPENWTATFAPWGQDAVSCELTVTLPDGRAVTKRDIGANSQLSERTKGADPGEDDKGGVADALKRAAVQLGVGRYLYGDGVPRFRGLPAREPDDDQAEPPAPRRDDRRPPREPSRPERPAPDRGGDDAPRTGGALYGWAKDNEWLNYLERWGRDRGFPGRMKEWEPGQVREAWAEVERRSEAQGESERFQRELAGAY